MGGPLAAVVRDWYVPVRDGIVPATRGDAVRHGVVRAAFLSVFIRDAQVLALFKEWGERTRLRPRMHALHGALRALGALTVLPPGTRVDELPDRLPTAVPPGPAVDQALAAVRAADGALCDRLAAVRGDEPLMETLRLDAIAFVGALGTPWPWLGAEVLTAFVLWVAAARIYEGRYVQRVGIGLWPAGGGLPRGKMPEKDVEKLQRDARWFYRVKIRSESVLAVARDEYRTDTNPAARRKDVRAGVRRAEALLALGHYQFAPGLF